MSTAVRRTRLLAPLAVPLAAAFAGLLAGPAQASCGSAYCALNTDLAAAAAGIVEGSSIDLRYESIDQTQPRAGSKKVGVGQIHRHHDEVRTLNRNLLASYSHMFASGWGFSVTAPFVDREHTHVHNHHGKQLQEEWSFREHGDLRAVGRYQSAGNADAEQPRTVGLIAGLKLPTGRTGIGNASGALAERSLQPGTGTTDLVLGGYLHQPLPQQDASWFAQAQVQRALNAHEGYRPGGQLSIDLGCSKSFGGKFSGIVQLNAVFKGRDSGTQAEPEDSGGRALFVAPGVGYQITERVSAYAYAQLPLYQYVNGVQLTADRAYVVGVTTRF